jgi:hypothetical protein
MRKGLIVLLVAVVAVAFALPAMADMTPTNLNVSGFYRSKAYLSNFHDGYSKPSIRTGDSNDMEQTNAFVEQRFRVKFAFGTENVQAVWFLESDNIWGDASGSNRLYTSTGVGGTSSVGADTTGLGAQRNTGGALGADRINTETKNIYVWFKVPDTSLQFTVGLQNQSDAYAGVIYGGADFAGVFMTGQFEPVKYKLGWAKLYENDTRKTDDMTLYVAETSFAPTKEVMVGLNFYFLQDDTQRNAVVSYVSSASGGALPSGIAGGANPYAAPNSKRVYMPGVTAAIKAGPATISGFAMYQFGTIAYGGYGPKKDIDIEAYMADARVDLNVGPGKAFVEGIYLSGSEDPQNKYKAPITLATNDGSPGGNSSYSRTNTYILMSAPDTINVSQCLLGCSGAEISSDPGANGRGMWMAAGGFGMPFTKQLKGEVNAAYLAAVKRLKSASGVEEDRKGNDIGTELNAQLTYNITKGLDVSGVGAYAWLGDFLNSKTGSSVKDAWTTYAKINYAY